MYNLYTEMNSETFDDVPFEDFIVFATLVAPPPSLATAPFASRACIVPALLPIIPAAA